MDGGGSWGVCVYALMVHIAKHFEFWTFWVGCTDWIVQRD
jgi:hypothetical protein